MLSKLRLSKDSYVSIFLMIGVFSLISLVSVYFIFSKKNPLIGAPQRDVLEAANEHANAAASDRLIVEPESSIQPLLSMIQNASSSVDLVMYELNDPEVEQALSDAQSRGVAVRVLLNQGYYGKSSRKNAAAYRYFQAMHVPVHWTSSSFALTHEKSLLVDKKQALIMTFNLEPKYYKTSRDFAVINHDPADIAAMDATFNADWEGKAIIDSSGDDLIWSPNSKDALLAILKNSNKSLAVYNEEMADSDIIQGLVEAAGRGVSVELIMAYSSKWKDAFTELSAAGVKIRVYKRKKPLYIHAKVIVVDSNYVFIGSQNFSTNSLLKNRELGLFIMNPPIATSLLKIFRNDWDGATQYPP
jgi:cardiolipin synthase